MEFCAGPPLHALQPEIPRASLLDVAAQVWRMHRHLHAVDPAPFAAIDKVEQRDKRDIPNNHPSPISERNLDGCFFQPK